MSFFLCLFSCSDHGPDKVDLSDAKILSQIRGLKKNHDFLSEYVGGKSDIIFQGEANNCEVLKNLPSGEFVSNLRNKLSGRRIVVVRILVKNYSPQTHLGGVGYLFLSEENHELIGHYINV